MKRELSSSVVMPGLVPGIHAFFVAAKTWMAGTGPAMTISIRLTQSQLIVRDACTQSSEKAGISMSKCSPLSLTMP